MGDFDNPAAGFVRGVFVFLFNFLAARADVRDVAVTDHGLAMFFTDISGIGAEILLASPFFRRIDDPAVQNLGQFGHVMPVGSCHDD